MTFPAVTFADDVIIDRKVEPANASITGGIFGGSVVISGKAPGGNTTVDGDTNLYAEGKFVSGGNFASPVPEVLCAAGYEPVTETVEIDGKNYYTVKSPLKST